MPKRARESSARREEERRPKGSRFVRWREAREKRRSSRPAAIRPELKRGAVSPTPRSLRAFSVQLKEGERWMERRIKVKARGGATSPQSPSFLRRLVDISPFFPRRGFIMPPSLPLWMKIGEAANRKLVRMDGGKSVLEACRLMGRKRIGSVLVTLNGKPYGIFTERDLLSKVLAKGVDLKKAKLKDYSSRPLVTVDENYTVKECARIMSEMGVRRLLVTSEGKLVGVFTSSDLTRVLSRAPLDF